MSGVLKALQTGNERHRFFDALGDREMVALLKRIEGKLDAVLKTGAGKVAPPEDFPTLIKRVAAEHYNVPLVVIEGKERWPDAVFARYAIFKVMREVRGWTHHRIGRAFGRDHGTVCHGIKALNNWLDTDACARAKYDELVEKVKKELGL